MSDKFSLNVYLDVRNRSQPLPVLRPLLGVRSSPACLTRRAPVPRTVLFSLSRFSTRPPLHIASSQLNTRLGPSRALRARAPTHTLAPMNHRIPSQSGNPRRALFASVNTMLLWALCKIALIAYTQGWPYNHRARAHHHHGYTQQDRTSGAAVSVEKRRERAKLPGLGLVLWDLGMDEEPGSDVRSDQNSAHPMIHIWH